MKKAAHIIKLISKPAKIYYVFCWLLLIALLISWRTTEDLFLGLLFLNCFNLIASSIISAVLFAYSYFFNEKRIEFFCTAILLLLQPAAVMLIILFLYF